MFKVALFIIPKCGTNQHAHQLDKEWINKMWYIHRKEYYLAIRRNELLTYAITWMNLKNITLSKRSYSQNNHLHKISRIGKSIDTESILMVA